MVHVFLAKFITSICDCETHIFQRNKISAKGYSEKKIVQKVN